MAIYISLKENLMPEIVRTRDCTLFFKGDAYPVTVDATMIVAGWPGGIGVQWTAGTNDERTVTFSDGHYGGILLWGSDETGDQYTAMTENQLEYRLATFVAGGSLISTTAYERYTWASRQIGPLVAIVYAINEPLYFSLRGYWTNEDEATLSGAAWAPNFFSGFVAQLPKANNDYRLGIQTSL